MYEPLLRFYSCDPLYHLQTNHRAFETELDEYGSVSSGRDNGFVWRTFTDASFHFHVGPTRQGHSRRSFALRRVRSLSLSVNLKSNYTRLRSQAVTQFVVIPRASIPANVSKLKLLKTLTAFRELTFSDAGRNQ